MQTTPVTMIRIYLTEQEKLTSQLLDLLHDEEQVQGVTVFRGISGFGQSGKLHSSSLLDLSLDLPIVIEFFEQPQKATAILERLDKIVPSGHIVSWQAQRSV